MTCGRSAFHAGGQLSKVVALLVGYNFDEFGTLMYNRYHSSHFPPFSSLGSKTV